MARRGGTANTGGPFGIVEGLLGGIIRLAIVAGVLLIVAVQVGNTLTGTSGSSSNVGTTGQTPIGFFNTVLGYINTPIVFTAIIVLLVVVAVLFAYLRSTGVSGGQAVAQR